MFFRKPNPDRDRLKLAILQEALRQYRASFNLAWSAIALSTATILLGAILLFSGQLAPGTLIATMGVFSKLRGIQLLRETQNAIALLGEWTEK
jgi:hypothetical protein